MGERFGGGQEAYFGREGLTALEEAERAKLRIELGERLQELGNNAAAEIINDDPVLDAMLSWLIKSGSGAESRSSPKAAHVRRMIALQLGPTIEIAEIGWLEELLGESARTILGAEHAEITGIIEVSGLDDLPDLWDIALQDLIGFRSDNE
jgi:hypothetical protein